MYHGQQPASTEMERTRFQVGQGLITIEIPTSLTYYSIHYMNALHCGASLSECICSLHIRITTQKLWLKQPIAIAGVPHTTYTHSAHCSVHCRACTAADQWARTDYHQYIYIIYAVPVTRYLLPASRETYWS